MRVRSWYEIDMHDSSVTLEDLCGQRMLSGRGEMVLRGTGTSGDDAFVVVLRLDDTFYWFQEDPDDGYRSSLGVVKKLLGYPQDMPPAAFVAFDPVMVTLSLRIEPGPERSGLDLKDMVLRAVDDRTGSVLFEIGTENMDDYYPNFVHRWTPDAMATYSISAPETAP